MLTGNRLQNCPVSVSTSNEPPVHLDRDASQLVVRTSVHFQGIKWRTDFISISSFLKAFEFKDQFESKRFGSIAF